MKIAHYLTQSAKTVTMLALLCALTFTTMAHAKTDSITLAIGYIPHIQFAPLYVGIEKGLYADQQIALEIEYGFGIDIFCAFNAGKDRSGTCRIPIN